METNGTLTFSQHFWRSAAMHHLQPRRRPASFGDACLGASRWGWWNAHCDFIQCLSEEEILKCLIWRWGGCLCNCFPPEAVSQMLVSCPHSIMFNSAYSWENKPHSSAISRIRTTIDQGGGRARGGWKTTLREHGRCLKMYNYASARSVPLAPLLFRPSPTSFIIRLPLSSFFSRLCWVWRRDQAGSVPPGVGEAVARQLLPMSDVQHGPHRRVHQQVSCAKRKRLALQEKTHGYTCKLCVSHTTAFFFFLFLFSLSQGWSAILWGGLPRPVRGEMWDVQQIHQRKGSGGENWGPDFNTERRQCGDSGTRNPAAIQTSKLGVDSGGRA